MTKISINTEEGIHLDKNAFKYIIKMIITDSGFKLSNMDFNFVNPDTMLEINKKYLEHNYDTDIITFDYSDETNNLDGEIFISFQEAVRNSKKYQVTVDNELVRLVIHGVLHLIGYDDTTALNKRKMKEVENAFVSKYKRYAKGLIKNK
jgi:probable rRNA maturation factor